MAYTLLRHLTDTQTPLLDQYNSSVSQWLQNMSELVSLFFRKHPFVDLVPTLSFLLNCLRTSTSGATELLVFRDLLSRMFGWSQFQINEMSDAQLQALAGGFRLRLEAMAQSAVFRKSQKSAEAIQGVMWS
mmetsp:Transcript_20079/g.14796  ORF Transcript_20079/g.14796 Transcript_20079/m.14796 type:complete len:131 (-) Transcript_20079:1910-2302(-)